MYYWPHYETYRLPLRLSGGSDKGIRHQEICPICGRKNVNLYLKDGNWACKRCCDAGLTEKVGQSYLQSIQPISGQEKEILLTGKWGKDGEHHEQVPEKEIKRN